VRFSGTFECFLWHFARFLVRLKGCFREKFAALESQFASLLRFFFLFSRMPLDLDKGTLAFPPVEGEFDGKRANSITSKPGKAAQFLCATSGSTFA
jgi:hypothetical protein